MEYTYFLETLTLSPTPTRQNISRFDTVCEGCSTTANEVPEGVNIRQEGGSPVCEQLPPGTIGRASGTTVAGLTLHKGYYRTSNKSAVVLECYRQAACAGGDDPSKYCAAGYEGACECKNTGGPARRPPFIGFIFAMMNFRFSGYFSSAGSARP